MKQPTMRFRLGLGSLILGTLSLLLLVLCFTPRYFMDDLLDALHWHVDMYYPIGICFLAMLFFILTGAALLYWGVKAPVNFGTVAVSVLLILVLITMLAPTFMRAAESPRFRSSCLGRQRQIATSMLMYAQDHHNKLPDNWQFASEYIDLKHFDGLACPDTTRYFHRRGGYGINSYTLGQSMNKFKHPELVLFTADALKMTSMMTSPDDIDRTRHGSGTGFLAAYLDGHAKFVPATTPIALK